MSPCQNETPCRWHLSRGVARALGSNLQPNQHPVQPVLPAPNKLQIRLHVQRALRRPLLQLQRHFEALHLLAPSPAVVRAEGAGHRHVVLGDHVHQVLNALRPAIRFHRLEPLRAAGHIPLVVDQYREHALRIAARMAAVTV